MIKKQISVLMMMVLLTVMLVPIRSEAGNLPQTPINRLLEYKSGLQLTDTQIKQLTLINNNIINKMLQLNGRAEMCKTQIESKSANWSDMDNPNMKSTVKEYYNCLAELKALEFEAMSKASEILSEEQIRKFNELAAIELMMIKQEPASLLAN